MLHLTFQLAYAWLATPFCLIWYLLGLRFVSADLTQVGSVIFLDTFLRENALTRRTPARKIFVCGSRYSDANGYLFDLYRAHLTFVRHPLIKLLLTPFFMNPPFRDTIFRFDAAHTFWEENRSTKCIAYETFNAFSAKFGWPLIGLTDEEKVRGRALLAEYIPNNRPFVCLHIRYSGFYGDRRRTTRNADIGTYEPAIQYLIGKGYAVVRLGDPSAVAIDDLLHRCGPGLFDYAHSDVRSEFLDCFLISQCDFFVGCTSGMWSLPIVFGKRICNVNQYTASTALGRIQGDLSTPKFLRRLSDQTPLPFDALLQPPFTNNPQREELTANGVILEDNSSEVVLATVKEFVERNSFPTPVQRLAKARIPDWSYAYGARGEFSNVFLGLYFPQSGGDLTAEIQYNSPETRFGPARR